MYLVLRDNSFIGDWGLELGYDNLKYIEINDELLNKLNCNFLYCFKKILRKEKLNVFKTLKRKPKNINKNLLFDCWTYKTNENLLNKIGYNYISDYENDLKIIEKWYEENEKEEFIQDNERKVA